MARLAVIPCTALAFLMCCSKSPPPPPGPTSGVDPGDDANPRFLTDLTLGERKKLCDWTAAIGGGYDASLICESGLVVSTFTSQQACLDAFLGSCSSVTVYVWEACIDKTAQNECADYLFTDVACAPIVMCLGMTDGGPAPDSDSGAD
jgi:hypothetical protein